MTRAAGLGLGFLGLVVAVACGAEPKGDGPIAPTGEAEDETSTAGEPEPDDDDTSTTSELPEETTTSEGEDESSTTCGFICDPTGDPDECDVWAQDCPEGQKCAPWVSDGGAAWDALRCVDVDANGGQPGDACQAEGGGGSGIDDCALGSMCWNVGEEGTGICVAFCGGTAQAPSCADTATTCIIANDGVLNLCLPICDPLLQDCGDGQACYPAGDAFACAPDVSGELGLFGDPCAAINTCDAGLLCANPELVPGCQGEGCCTSFCEIDDGTDCPAQGQECVTWYEPGQAPPGAESLGACVIPE